MSKDTSWDPSGKSSSASGEETLEADRRGAQRHPFSADAEVTELRSGLKLSARVSDLSLKGCYIDTLNPYAAGTAVSLRLHKGKDVFEARANVSYRQAGFGMGLDFEGLVAEQRAKLEIWLSELGVEVQSRGPGKSEAVQPEPVSSPDHALIIALVRLLNCKGILTNQESAALLDGRLD